MAADARTRVIEIAYERARAQLDHSRTRLSEIRTNSAILLAATALIASFLGDWSLGKGEGIFGALALGTFVLGILCGTAPVLPVVQRTDYPGVRGRASRALCKLDGGQLWGRGPTAEDILAIEEPPENAIVRAAETMSGHAVTNTKITDRRSAWVIASGFFLVTQVVLWVANAIAQG